MKITFNKTPNETDSVYLSSISYGHNYSCCSKNNVPIENKREFYLKWDNAIRKVRLNRVYYKGGEFAYATLKIAGYQDDVTITTDYIRNNSSVLLSDINNCKKNIFPKSYVRDCSDYTWKDLLVSKGFTPSCSLEYGTINGVKLYKYNQVSCNAESCVFDVAVYYDYNDLSFHVLPNVTLNTQYKYKSIEECYADNIPQVIEFDDEGSTPKPRNISYTISFKVINDEEMEKILETFAELKICVND